MLTGCIQREGWRCCLHDGITGLERLVISADLIILDLMLPGLMEWKSAASSARNRARPS